MLFAIVDGMHHTILEPHHLRRHAPKCSVTPAVLVGGLQDTATQVLCCKPHVQLLSCKARELLLAGTSTTAFVSCAAVAAASPGGPWRAHQGHSKHA